jgi:excisionase family DNA binding protein
MTISLNDLGDIITTKELSLFLKFGYAKTLNFIKYSGIRYKKIGNAYRITKQDLSDFLATKESEISLNSN